MNQVNQKIVYLTVLTLVILTALFLIYNRSGKQPLNATDAVIEDSVASEGVLRVPQGFPADIPIEGANLLSALKVFYPDTELTHYSLSYHSNDTLEAKWGQYSGFLTDAGYNLSTPDNSNVGGINLAGYQDDRSLLINITRDDDQTVVVLNLYER
jgi:hypothetical protein